MILDKEYQEIVEISTKIINKYSTKWNKCTIFTGYCNSSYGGFSLFYQDVESKDMSYWGELYTNIANNEMYSFEGYDFINEILKKHYLSCQNDLALRWNKGTLTIYPSGEYESSFIWDEGAHLDYLVLDIDTFFSFLYDEVPLYLDRNYHNDTLWDSIEIRISFQEGKIQPLKIVLKTGEITTDYAVLIQNITYDESIYLIKRFEDIYELTNNGELKGVLSPTWNTAIMRYQAIDYFDFKKQVSFEWREENA